MDDDLDPETERDHFKTAINQVATEELGYRKNQAKTWVSQETEGLMKRVTKAKGDMLAVSKENNSEKTKHLKELRKQLKKNLSEDRNNMLENVVKEMEDAYKRGHSKKLFANVKRLSGDFNNKLINIDPVKKQMEK